MTASDPTHIRNLRTPVQETDLALADRSLHVLQFGVGPAPAPRDHAMVNAFLADHPWVRLPLDRTDIATDLEFLRSYKDAKRILIGLYAVRRFDGLRHLPEDLEFLGLGDTQARRISLRPILRFTQLRQLFRP